MPPPSHPITTLGPVEAAARGPLGSRGPRRHRDRRAAAFRDGASRISRPQKSQRAAPDGRAARGDVDRGLARADHRRASTASLRPRRAERNPDASSFPAPRRARGTPVAAACGWPARGRGAGTARPLASAARAGPPARTAGSRCSPGHRGGRCAPPPRTARTRRPAPRHPPPLGRPEGFTGPAARAILYPVIRWPSRHRGR